MEGADIFASKFNLAGTELITSTLFGGSGLDIAVGIVVDDDGGPHILLETDSPNLPVTDDAIQPQLAGRVRWFHHEGK